MGTMRLARDGGTPMADARLASGSASIARTGSPSAANWRASIPAREVFPTPPLPLMANFCISAPNDQQSIEFVHNITWPAKRPPRTDIEEGEKPERFLPHSTIIRFYPGNHNSALALGLATAATSAEPRPPSSSSSRRRQCKEH